MLAVAAATKPAASPCPPGQGAWEGRCLSRYEWTTDEARCPDGVVLTPEGGDGPRCVSCDQEIAMQQPLNHCAGVRLRKATAVMQERLDALARDFPAKAGELRKGQADWQRKCDAACRTGMAGGSMAPFVEASCRTGRTEKRTRELAGMRKSWSTTTPR
jgi:uncharacterized protein YecT (DUF1311 family)